MYKNDNSSSLKCCDYNNQEKDTRLNRSIYNNDNYASLKYYDRNNQNEDTSLYRSMYNNKFLISEMLSSKQSR